MVQHGPALDNGGAATYITPDRIALVRRGQRLEYFTIAYNSLEGLVSIIAGAIAGSVSLIGFGLDSLVEVTSGAALLWRLHHDLDHSRREQVERSTLRILGGCFIALATYILYESGSTLIGHGIPKRSIPGIIIAAASVVVMPLLARGRLLPGSEAEPCKPTPGRRTSAHTSQQFSWAGCSSMHSWVGGGPIRLRGWRWCRS